MQEVSKINQTETEKFLVSQIKKAIKQNNPEMVAAITGFYREFTKKF